MNNFDFSILTALNSLVNLHPRLDALIVHVQHDNLIKGGIFMAVWWYLWFQHAAAKDRILTHGKLIAGLVAMTLGIFIARILAHILPFRIRPFENPELHFTAPAWTGSSGLAGWSSFPSDHAVAWFSIAVTVYLINKRFGLVIIGYALFLGVGRIYAGYHHPTDIMAGAALGITSVLICNISAIQRKIIFPFLQWGENNPGRFYALIFLCTYEISNMFDELRSIGELAKSAVGQLL